MSQGYIKKQLIQFPNIAFGDYCPPIIVSDKTLGLQIFEIYRIIYGGERIVMYSIEGKSAYLIDEYVDNA